MHLYFGTIIVSLDLKIGCKIIFIPYAQPKNGYEIVFKIFSNWYRIFCCRLVFLPNGAIQCLACLCAYVYRHGV